MLDRQELHVKLGFCGADMNVGTEGVDMKSVDNFSCYVKHYLPKLHPKYPTSNNIKASGKMPTFTPSY
jgi:hypothetical protein